MYLKCLFTFVVAVDLTVTASDVKMPANKTNKTEGLSLSPRDFLTDRPGAFAPWFALCCAEATNNDVLILNHQILSFRLRLSWSFNGLEHGVCVCDLCVCCCQPANCLFPIS